MAMLFQLTLAAQPVNDNCSGAIEVVNPTTFWDTGTLNGATPTSTTLLTCGNFVNEKDVWYRTPVQSSGLRVEVKAITAFAGLTSVVTPKIQIFRGANCSSLVGVSCNGGVGSNNYISTTAPATNDLSGYYYIRVFDIGGGTEFSICTAPIPVNDLCVNAIEVTLDAAGNGCQIGSLLAASFSISTANLPFSTNCPNSNTNGLDDVWYKLTNLSPTALIVTVSSDAVPNISTWS